MVRARLSAQTLKKVVAELAKFQERLHGVAHAIFDEAKESDKGVQLVVIVI